MNTKIISDKIVPHNGLARWYYLEPLSKHPSSHPSKRPFVLRLSIITDFSRCLCIYIWMQIRFFVHDLNTFISFSVIKPLQYYRSRLFWTVGGTWFDGRLGLRLALVLTWCTHSFLCTRVCLQGRSKCLVGVLKFQRCLTMAVPIKVVPVN